MMTPEQIIAVFRIVRKGLRRMPRAKSSAPTAGCPMPARVQELVAGTAPSVPEILHMMNCRRCRQYLLPRLLVVRRQQLLAAA